MANSYFFTEGSKESKTPDQVVLANGYTPMMKAVNDLVMHTLVSDVKAEAEAKLRQGPKLS